MDLNVTTRTGHIEQENRDTSKPNKHKKKFNERLNFYFDKMANISISLDTLQQLYKNEQYFLEIGNFAPAFFRTLINNFRAQIVIQLCAFYSKKDKLSLYKFFNFTKSKFSQIFTGKFFEKIYWDDNTIEEKETQMSNNRFLSTIEDCEKLIEDKQEDIGKLFKLRDKFYAHYEKLEIPKDATITFEEIGKIYKLTEEILNKIQVFYNRTITCCKPANANDFDNVAFAIKKYNQHYDYILNKELEDNK